MTAREIFKSSYSRLNSAAPISRETNILGKLDSDLMSKCWDQMSLLIIKNYESGKGTYIPKFGSFTFQNPLFSMEGTTNEVKRDTKPRLPIFIVSSDFVEGIRPGIYSDKGSIIFHEQKSHGGMNCVKLNVSEIAVSLNLGKAECSIIIDNLLRLIGDKIRSGEFKSKNLPGLGVLLLRNKTLAIKFEEAMSLKSMNAPQILLELKKNFNLSNEVVIGQKPLNNKENGVITFNNSGNLPQLSKSVSTLRPQTALLSKMTDGAQKYLTEHFGIKREDIEESKEITPKLEKTGAKEFLGESKTHRVKSKRLKDLLIKDSILEGIIYQKAFIINQMKAMDIEKSGQISKDSIVKSFMSCGIADCDEDLISSIISLYWDKGDLSSSANQMNRTTNSFMPVKLNQTFNKLKVDSIDFMSLMLNLIKDIKECLTDKQCGSKQVSDTNFRSSTSFRKNASIKSFTSLQKPQSTEIEDKKEGNPFTKQSILLDNIKPEIITIKTIAGDIKEKYAVMMGQTISNLEFMKILREFSIVYPETKINQILAFLELTPKFFTLAKFFKYLDNCKILVSETLTKDIIAAIKKIKDLVYSNGGSKFFFDTDDKSKLKNSSISKSKFITRVRSKLKTFSDDLITGVFYYITKMDRDMNYEDYKQYFETEVSNINPNLFVNSENFMQLATETILDKMNHKNLKEEEYFDRFLRLKNNRQDNYLSRLDFHSSLKSENFEFSAQEIDLIFDKMDTKRDDIIDRSEFVSFLRIVHDPLYQLQDIIKQNKLEIEEILFRLNISQDKHEVFDFWNFKNRMRLLNSGFNHEFIFAIFLKLKNADDKVDSRILIKELNVFKKQNFQALNTDSFKNNFLTYYRERTNLKALKDLFERRDSQSSGTLDKVDFCRIVRKFNDVNQKSESSADYKDEDVMKICRICELYNKDNKVNYTKFLELLFYNSEDNNFNLICEKLVKNIINPLTLKIGKDKKEKAKASYTNSYATYNPLMEQLFLKLTNSASTDRISISSFINFCKEEFGVSASIQVIQLFDVDKDGYINSDDMKAIIDRYSQTHYFKYETGSATENSNLSSRVNFYCSEELSEEKFKMLVKDIKAAMKNKNLTDVGLFNKLDTNKDGFISSPEFNSNIDLVFPIASNIKDQFFSFLDVRKLGLVDLDTFKKRFKDYSSVEVIVKNDWELEERIIRAFQDFLRKDCLGKKLTIYEIFAVLDYDIDGKVSVDDYKKFVIEKLKFSPFEINDFRLERVIQHISKNKLNFFTIHDIKEYINDFITEQNSETKELNTLTRETFNLNPEMKGVDWINSVFEKFGLYVSEKYSNFENFFEAVNKDNTNSEKIKIDDFIKFISTNHLSLKGFNLTKDELISFFTAFDSHKKSYITITDIKNKLGDYDYYRRMRQSIKTFLNNNFKNGAEAFRFFIADKNVREEKEVKESLTKKEMFDGINLLFPSTYSTENILKFILINFRNIEKIAFSEFNFLFFNEVTHDSNLKQFTSTKTGTYNVFGRLTATDKNTKMRASSAYLKSNPKSKLVTPYDEDSLEKLRRLLKSSRFNFTNVFKMYDLLHNGFVNQSEFRSMIKKLNIGLTAIEIDEIISKSGKNREGNIDMKEFFKFINYQDLAIKQITENLKSFVADLKQLVYKYYANPRLAFQFNDKQLTNEITLDKFKNLVHELYLKETRPSPNYSIIKNCFEYIDLRKDGVIDLNEWSKCFSMTESNLDPKGKCSDQALSSLREWESSKDITAIFEILSKNRKLIRDLSKDYLINESKAKTTIYINNLINVMNSILSGTNQRLSKTQWKMLAAFADKDKTGLIDFEEFMMIVNNSAKTTTSHPKLFKD